VVPILAKKKKIFPPIRTPVPRETKIKGGVGGESIRKCGSLHWDRVRGAEGTIPRMGMGLHSYGQKDRMSQGEKSTSQWGKDVLLNKPCALSYVKGKELRRLGPARKHICVE